LIMNPFVFQELHLTDKEFHTISEMVYKHCGIHLDDEKKELVRSRLSKRLRLLGYVSYSDYVDYICQPAGKEEFASFIDSISTNFTSFFREKQHFDFLQKNFLPGMLETKARKGDYRLRAWCAGCSSGEELYTIAITILDTIGDNLRWDVKILATDISTRMLEAAKKGVYEQTKIEPLSGAQRQRYLTVSRSRDQKLYEVSPELKKMTIVRYMNFMDEWPIQTSLDFIFCRNVMIYFDRPTQQKLVARFCNLLEPGGILFTGHSESLTGIRHSFNYIEPAVYQKPVDTKACTKEE
jgi:chemotaxis protein methyltransferase CheR